MRWARQRPSSLRVFRRFLLPLRGHGDATVNCNWLHVKHIAEQAQKVGCRRWPDDTACGVVSPGGGAWIQGQLLISQVHVSSPTIPSSRRCVQARVRAWKGVQLSSPCPELGRSWPNTEFHSTCPSPRLCPNTRTLAQTSREVALPPRAHRSLFDVPSRARQPTHQSLLYVPRLEKPLKVRIFLRSVSVSSGGLHGPSDRPMACMSLDSDAPAVPAGHVMSSHLMTRWLDTRGTLNRIAWRESLPGL